MWPNFLLYFFFDNFIKWQLPTALMTNPIKVNDIIQFIHILFEHLNDVMIFFNYAAKPAFNEPGHCPLFPLGYY